MDDEPVLPRLPPSITWNAQTERFSNNPKKRRHGLEHAAAPPSCSNSSDPAIFSSDDDPGLDNYVDGRRKKRYTGTWYQQKPISCTDAATGEPRPAVKGKRVFRRDMDSGVYMGSDSTDGNESTMMPDLPTQARLPQLNNVQAPARRRKDYSPEELAAREKIQQCLDDGEESVDLSCMGLQRLSAATIRPLAELTCIPVVAEGVPFVHKDPELQLYLWSNPLQRLPGAIFDLEHLTVLSLRACGLRELPPAIGKMRKLRTLNVGQNLLKSLPAEVLGLMTSSSSLRQLILQGNQFYRPKELPSLSDLKDFGAEGSNERNLFETGKLAWNGLAARFFARSPAHYLNTSGQSLSAFQLDPEAVVVPVEPLEDTENTSLATPPSSAPYQSKSACKSLFRVQASRVPSLVELALRSAYKSSDINELPDLMTNELPHLSAMLERAADLKEIGGMRCASCKKVFVAPTMQWLEWWQVCLVENLDVEDDRFLKARPWTDLPEENDGAVPFLRRGCSWKCGPADIEEGQWSTQRVEEAA